MSERHREHELSRRTAIHKDWRTWVAVIVMLGTVGVYVLTLDDSVDAGAEPGIDAPADAGSATP